MSLQVQYTAEPTAQRFHASDAFFRGLRGPYGCLSGDHEFLTRTGWKRMDAYEGDEEVLVHDPHTGETRFEQPQAYTDEPCDGFYHFHGRGVDQMLSSEHKVLHYKKYDPEVPRTAQAADIAAQNERLSSGWDGMMPTSFSHPHVTGLPLGEDALRLMVAVCADGHFAANTSPRCTVTLRKERKKARLEQLLEAVGVEWTTYDNPNRPTETAYRFDAPHRNKTLAAYWGAEEREQEAILDELPQWDGMASFAGNGPCFVTTDKDEADFVQYLFAGAGRRASINTQHYPDEGWSTVYRVAETRGAMAGVRGGDHSGIDWVPTPGGRKYCFTVSTGFFVTRRNDKIAVTGNSGKSVACVMEILQRSLRQQPNAEGKRKTRWAIIRQSYPELETTTIKTWKEWVPDSICPIKKTTPMQGKMITPLPDGTTVDMEVIFMAVPTPDDVKKLLSLELTGAWVNEAKEVPKEVIEGVTERVGRYPSKRDGGPTWDGVIADTNSMDDDHWWYDLAEEQRPPGYEFFDQPSALLFDADGRLVANPNAENVTNQPKGYDYWLDMAQGKNEDRVKVFILNEYGSTVEGRPVFPEFNEKLHVSDRPLQAATNRPLILGWDYGLTPACLVLQVSPHGQLRVLDEFTTGLSDEGMAPKQFARDIVRPAIDQKYPGMELDSWGDPGDARGSDGSLARDHLKAHGIPTRPAWTNRLQPRLDSVRTFLNKMVDGEPGFVLDPSIEVLRKGLKSRYVFERVQVSGQEARYKDQPVKNSYSHVCDALQYACLTVERQNRRQSTPKPKVGNHTSGRAGY